MFDRRLTTVDKMKSVLFGLFSVIAFLTKDANGQLRCYVCSFTQTDTDQSCLTITELTQIINCDMQYCIILRQEHVDPRNEIASFSRSCMDDPDFLNHMVDDGTFRTFYRACTADLCNIGNGIQLITGGTLSAHPIFDSPNLLVPGTGTSKASLKISSFLCVFSSLLYLFLKQFSINL